MAVAARRCLLAGALWVVSATVAAQAADEPAWHPYAQARAWAAYDAIAIADLDGDWAGGVQPRGGRNVMLQRHRAEAGVERGAWRIGWEYRQEATLITDRQTLGFVRRYKQRIKPLETNSYALAARLERWSAQGLRLGRWFGDADGLLPRVRISGAVYTRASLRDTALDGSVLYRPVDQYEVDLRRSEADTSARYPFMREQPGGAGVSMALALAWRLAPALTANIDIDDLWSVMRYTGLPFKEERLDTKVSALDADGYINYRPLLSGVNRQATVNRKLGRSGNAGLTYDSGALLLGANVERLAGVTIPSLSLGRRFGWGVLSTRVESRFRTVGIGIDTDHLNVALQTDTLRLHKAKALGLTMAVRF